MVNENVVISFIDDYKMAATKSIVTGGGRTLLMSTAFKPIGYLRFEPAKIVVSTSLKPIKYGQSYTLPKDWTDGTVQSDPNAPDNGFLFINQTPSAACVLFKNFAGQFNPIYTTVAGPVPPGTEAIVPTEKVSVWFQVGDEQPGTKVNDDFKTTSITVDFNGTTTRTVKYDADGNWSIVN